MENNTEEKKLNAQQIGLKTGRLKHVGCILTTEELAKVEDIQQLIQILVPNNKIGLSGVLRFMLKTYHKECKEQMLSEIRQTLSKGGAGDF